MDNFTSFLNPVCSLNEDLLKKITDDYYIYDLKKENKLKLAFLEYSGFSKIEESIIPLVDNTIQSIFCEKYNEADFKIYACLSNINKILIFICDIKAKSIKKNEDEIFYNNENNSEPFIKCIEIPNKLYIVTATSNSISLWMKIKDIYNCIHNYNINLNNDDHISDILAINSECFICSYNTNKIIFYNTKIYSESKEINIDCIDRIDSLLFFKEYILIPCNKGIGIIFIQTKELIQYLESDKDCLCIKICFNNENSLFALFNQKIKYEEEEDDVKKVYLIEYIFIDNNFRQIRKFRTDDIFID